MGSNNQENLISGAITFPQRSNDDVQALPNQPRQPRNLQGLLRFALEATKAEDAPGNSELGPMDEERRKFLEQALKSLTVDVAGILRKAINVLTDAEKMRSVQLGQTMPEDVQTAFLNLMEFADDIDIANDFYKLGGFAVFPICYSSENEEVRAAASSLLAELCQNNPYCQARALECGLLVVLLNLADNEQGTTLAKNIYAISCATREFEPACKVLVENAGCELLMRLVSNPEKTVRTKATFLIRHLCQHYPEAKEKFIENNIARMLAELVKKGRDSTTEHILGTFHALLEGLDPTALRQCRDPDLGLKKILENHLQHPDLKEDTYVEEKEYCQELLKQLFENWTPVEEVDR